MSYKVIIGKDEYEVKTHEEIKSLVAGCKKHIVVKDSLDGRLIFQGLRESLLWSLDQHEKMKMRMGVQQVARKIHSEKQKIIIDFKGRGWVVPKKERLLS